VVYSEDFTGSHGLMTAILNVRSKLYRDGENLENVGISGVLTLKREDSGNYRLTLQTRP
jgi:hypothetical protein